jgi:uncharacterized protein (DUF952 family)
MPEHEPTTATTPILHITERALWDAARERGTYEWSTRGRTLQ